MIRHHTLRVIRRARPNHSACVMTNHNARRETQRPESTNERPAAAMRSVLICYDATDRADLAVRSAGTLLRPKHAVVLLVPPFTDAGPERGRQVALDAGFEAVTVVKARHARVAAAVLDQARRRDASVIVAGSRGGAPSPSGLTGALLRRADRPVLVGPPAAPPSLASEPILMAYDGSLAARQALAAAGELLVGRAAIIAAFMPAVDEVAVLRVSLPWPAAAETRDDLARLDREEAWAPGERADEGARLAATAGFAPRALGIAGIDASSEEEEEPWRRLLRSATEAEAGCIVVGHQHSARGVTSMAHNLVSHADCPVLVVPEAP
jgi:nucleotide-binding universal stress UspA family protein